MSGCFAVRPPSPKLGNLLPIPEGIDRKFSGIDRKFSGIDNPLSRTLDIEVATRFLTSLQLQTLESPAARDVISAGLSSNLPLRSSHTENWDDTIPEERIHSREGSSLCEMQGGVPVATTLDLAWAVQFLTSLELGTEEDAVELETLEAAKAAPAPPLPELFNRGMSGQSGHRSGFFQVAGVKAGEGTSYAQFLVPSEGKEAYDPSYLGDPVDGRSMQIIQDSPDVWQQEDGIVFPFFTAFKTHKQELNEKFRKAHPWLPESLTLSKLRNLQRDLLMILDRFPPLDVSTVAMAWVYVERLVIRGLVQKSNRKLLAGVCLVLAYKFNQNFEEGQFKQLASCIRDMDRKDRLNEKDIKNYETQVFVWLEFNLRAYREWVIPHIENMLKHLNTEYKTYYKEEMCRNEIGPEESMSVSLDFALTASGLPSNMSGLPINSGLRVSG